MIIDLRKDNKRIPRTEFEAVIRAINRCLDGQWSSNQLKKGMQFEIRESWKAFYKDLIKRYRDVGWEVKTSVELIPGDRKVYLNIQHPGWAKKMKKESKH